VLELDQADLGRKTIRMRVRKPGVSMACQIEGLAAGAEFEVFEVYLYDLREDGDYVFTGQEP
jgi:hypothetical protein